jgi:hypothetical protein
MLDVVVSTRAIRLRGRTCLVGVWRDIGDRKAAERRWKESRPAADHHRRGAAARLLEGPGPALPGLQPGLRARRRQVDSPAELLGKDDHQLVWADQAGATAPTTAP